MRWLNFLAGVGALLVVGAVSMTDTSKALATPGVIDVVAIDMQDTATPANANNSVGSIETCLRMNRNGILDADEDQVDRLRLDVVIPNPGVDEVDQIRGYAFDFNYQAGDLRVDDTSYYHLVPDSGVAVFPEHQDSDGSFRLEHSAIGTTFASGPGILVRLTIGAIGTASPEILPLTLTDEVELDGMVTILDGAGAPIPVTEEQNARVALDASCSDLDSDNDTVPNYADNCSTVPNQNQANADGDSMGDACDTCPVVPTTWGVPPGDTDCDGFPDTVTTMGRGRENLMGTDAGDRCADTTIPNDEQGPTVDEPLSPWPPDLNDTRATNVSDIVMFGGVFNTVGPDPPYNPRFDLNASGGVNMSDIVVIGPFYNKSCMP